MPDDGASDNGYVCGGPQSGGWNWDMFIETNVGAPAPGFISGAALWLKTQTVSVGLIHLPNPTFNTSYNLATYSSAPLPGTPLYPPNPGA